MARSEKPKVVVLSEVKLSTQVTLFVLEEAGVKFFEIEVMPRAAVMPQPIEKGPSGEISLYLKMETALALAHEVLGEGPKSGAV